MWELDHKEGWTPKNWCFQIVVLEKTLDSPLDCKESKLASPKGNQSWIFIGRTDAEAETPILWPPDVKNWVTGKDPDSDWRQEGKGTTEDETVGWNHQLEYMSLTKLRKLVMDRDAWHAAVYGVAKSWTWLSDWIELIPFGEYVIGKSQTFKRQIPSKFTNMKCCTNKMFMSVQQRVNTQYILVTITWSGA